MCSVVPAYCHLSLSSPSFIQYTTFFTGRQGLDKNVGRIFRGFMMEVTWASLRHPQGSHFFEYVHACVFSPSSFILIFLLLLIPPF